MSEGPSVLIAGDSSCEKAVLQRWPGARVVGTFSDLALVEYVLAGLKVDFVIVDPKMSTRGETFQAWTERFRAAFPGVSLLVAGGPDFGIAQAASAPGPEETRPAAVLTSQTIVIWSPKGGVGKTFIASNLACAAALATEGHAILLDFDLYAGDVAVHLDLLDGPTITELLPELGEIRPEALTKYAQKHGPTGLHVICSPRRPELSDLVTPEHVRTILSLAEKKWGLVYVDTPPDITSDVVGECVERASRIVLVVTQDIATLRQSRAAIDIFRRLGIPDDSIAVVLNRVSKDSLMPQAKIQEYLGLELAGAVPDDRKTVERSIFEGKPAVLWSRNDISEAIWQIASRLSPGLPGPRDHRRTMKSRKGLLW